MKEARDKARKKIRQILKRWVQKRVTKSSFALVDEVKDWHKQEQARLAAEHV